MFRRRKKFRMFRKKRFGVMLRRARSRRRYRISRGGIRL